MPSADIGTIVSDAEVISFVQDWSTEGNFSRAEELLITGVEARVRRETGQDYSSAVVTDEEHTIKPPITRDGIIIRETTQFRVNNFPITIWTSLKKVTARDSTTGLPSTTETLQRNSYHVDMNSGIVTLISPDLLDEFDAWPSQGFPSGTKILLASYTAGNVPDDLKLLVLQIIARLHLQQKNKLWGRTNQSIDGMQNSYPDIAFTESEKRALRQFKKWHFA